MNRLPYFYFFFFFLLILNISILQTNFLTCHAVKQAFPLRNLRRTQQYILSIRLNTSQYAELLHVPSHHLDYSCKFSCRMIVHGGRHRMALNDAYTFELFFRESPPGRNHNTIREELSDSELVSDFILSRRVGF